jgi:SAM-dependent methyltransferase
MGELQNIDAEQIAERIRESIRRQRQDLFSVSRPPGQGGQRLAGDLSALQLAYDVYGVDLGSRRRLTGAVVLFLKRVVRRLLAPVLARQVQYNARNLAVVRQLNDEIDALFERDDDLRELLASEAKTIREAAEAASRQQSDLRHELDGLTRVAEEQTKQLGALRGYFETVTARQGRVLDATREHVSRAERKFRRVLQGSPDVETAATPGGAASSEPEFDYFGFEERFRGSEVEIKERQRIYLDSFRDLGPVLDVGCGRGEFLELMRETNVQATGVDVDADMVLACREKGLDVVRGDAFAHLETLPDDSLGGIFSAQVVEHLEPSRIVQLLGFGLRKLRPGGLIVLETINPQCAGGLNAFYLDPSHVKPVHPDTLSFMLESSRYRDVVIRYIGYDAARTASFSDRDEQWRRTYCPDYAAFARK